METIYADFNNQDEDRHVRLNLAKSREGLSRLGDHLCEGAAVWLADEEGRVQAKLHNRNGIWVGIPEWGTWQDVPFGVETGIPAAR